MFIERLNLPAVNKKDTLGPCSYGTYILVDETDNRQTIGTDHYRQQ